MTIKIANPFKSQPVKAFDKSKIGRNLHVGECIPSADVNLHLGKKIFQFGTATTVMDDNLSEPEPLEHMKAIQSPSLVTAREDIQVAKQKKLFAKVKSAKKSVAKLFKSATRAPAAVPGTDPFATPSIGIECNATNDHLYSLSPPCMRQHVEPQVRAHTAPYESALPPYTGSETIAFPVTPGQNVAKERIEGLASTFCGSAEASPPSSTGQPFRTLELQLDTLSWTFSFSELHTFKDEDEDTQVVRAEVANAERKKLAVPGSYIFRSNSDFEATVRLCSDTLFGYTTPHASDSADSDTDASPVDTSLATSVDAEESRSFSPGALRRLRRVPKYEDLRGLQIIAKRDLSCPDLSLGSSDCDLSCEVASVINAAPHRSTKFGNLRKSFLFLKRKTCTSSIRQTNEDKEHRARLSMRCRELPRGKQRTAASGAPKEPQKATPVSRSRQFLQDIFHPSSRVEAHVLRSSLPPLSSPLLPPVPIWSCAKITQSSAKAKKRRRMTKRSMRELKARLDSMDIDPWY